MSSKTLAAMAAMAALGGAMTPGFTFRPGTKPLHPLHRDPPPYTRKGEKYPGQSRRYLIGTNNAHKLTEGTQQ